MKTSSLGAAELRKFEHLELKAYPDSAQVWTIGYGTTKIKGKPVQPGMRCTKEQAEEWFQDDLKDFEDIVNKQFGKVKLNQNQFDALVMFVYNNGSFAKAPTLVKAITKNTNDEVIIRNAFLLYVKVRADKDGIDNDGDGVVDEPGELKTLRGLVNRRGYEIDWYFGKHKSQLS